MQEKTYDKTKDGRFLMRYSATTMADAFRQVLKVEKPWQELTEAEKLRELAAHKLGRLRPIKDGRGSDGRKAAR